MSRGKMLHDGRHPLWKILRIAVVGGLLLLFLHLNYKHGLVPEKDVGTIVSVLLGLIGFDVAKDRIVNGGGNSDDKKTSDSEEDSDE